MKGISQFVGFLLVAVAAAVVLVSIAPTPPKPIVSPTPTPTIIPTTSPTSTTVPSDLKTFSSWTEISSFLSSVPREASLYRRIGELPLPLAAMPMAAKAEAATDYSTTNVQVEGVDEADIMKNDGQYIYTISNGQIVILRAFPPSEAKVLSILKDPTFSGMFINGDKLVAFGNEEFNWDPIVRPLEKQFGEETVQTAKRSVAPEGMPVMPSYYPRRLPTSFIKVYDVSDRSAPKLLKTINSKGSYTTSRMIGSKVYAIFSEYAQYGIPRPIYAVDGDLREIQPSEINYFDYPFESYQFTTVLGLDLDNLAKEESRKIVLMGGGQNSYVSKENAYITYTRYNYYYPLWEAYSATLTFPKEVQEKIGAIEASDASQWRKDNMKIAETQKYLATLNETQRTELYSEIYKKEQEIHEKQIKQSETTVIHKFALSDSIAYIGKGEAPGHVLNQFSMDEFNGYFRIATTVGEPSKNNVYVLDSSLKALGKLEDLAPGEKIYSARFMGNRAYLVTFKKIDPLFVIGLEDPTNPIMLGKLKIPGYSDYLHPYDETHLIGLGKDAVPAEEGDFDFAWYQGVKLSLFDVSDVSTPKELATYAIGDRGTESYALHNHKAFLFSRQRNLLVIPILLAEINKEKYPQGVTPQSYGDFVFQGAYVFNIDLNGFKLKGRVSHADVEALKKSGDYYFGDGTDVKRSAYMDDMLYSISDRFVKANDLNTLEEKASVELPTPKQKPIIIAEEVTIR